MNSLGSFALRPFDVTAQTANLALSAEVFQHETTLSIVYTLSGDLNSVEIPPVGQSPQRRDRLWEKTCFEFFLMQGESPSKTSPYWEFNLSPTGDWNVFALSGYRQGLTETSAFVAMPFTVQASPTELKLNVSVDVSSLSPLNKPLHLGVSAVVVLAGGQETFWAIAHPALEADFHHPDSFVIPL